MNIFDKIYIGMLNAQANADAKRYLRQVRAAETAKIKKEESDKETPVDKAASNETKNNKKEKPNKKETPKETPKTEEVKEEKTTPVDGVKEESKTETKVEGSENAEATITVDKSSTSAASDNAVYTENSYYDMSSFVKNKDTVNINSFTQQTTQPEESEAEKYFRAINMMRCSKVTSLNETKNNSKLFIIENIKILENKVQIISSSNEELLKQIEAGTIDVTNTVNEESKKFFSYADACIADIEISVNNLSIQYNFSINNDVAAQTKRELLEYYQTAKNEIAKIVMDGDSILKAVNKAIADRRVTMSAAGYGYCQIDNADPLQKKPKPKKVEPEKVDLDLPEEIKDGPETVKPPEKVNAGKLDERIEVKETVQDDEPSEKKPTHPVFDNSKIFNENNGYLKDICDLAEKNDIGIEMIPNIGPDGKPNGLITCNCYTSNSGKNVPKCFTIDTGNIMDRRPKMFMETVESLQTTNDTFEGKQAYHITDFDKEKKKKTINDKLFNYFFQSGKLIQTDDKVNKNFGMYNPEDIELNKHVALITFNKKGLDKDLNKEFRSRMIGAMNTGLFNEYPNVRFELLSFDPKKKTFILTSENVPMNYGSAVVSQDNYKIEFGENSQTTVTKL